MLKVTEQWNRLVGKRTDPANAFRMESVGINPAAYARPEEARGAFYQAFAERLAKMDPAHRASYLRCYAAYQESSPRQRLSWATAEFRLPNPFPGVTEERVILGKDGEVRINLELKGKGGAPAGLSRSISAAADKRPYVSDSSPAVAHILGPPKKGVALCADEVDSFTPAFRASAR